MSEPVPVPFRRPFREYAPAWLKIKTKQGTVVPFVLNEPQERVEQLIAELRSQGRPVRLLILKARQLGFSTWALGKAYEHSTQTKGTTALMAAHDDESTVELFERVRLMHDLAPSRPMTRYSNRRELNFANPNKRDAIKNPGLLSKLVVGTAGRINLGRSKTLRFVHCSEVAFWKDAERSLLSLEQAIPGDNDTVEILESTANGVGGEFYNRWQRAMDPATRGDWRAIFFAWHSFAEYRRPLEDGKLCPLPSCVVDVSAFEREENELRALFKLDEEQVNWRRWAIVNKCGNNLDNFHQEYPSTPEEAFLTSGRPVFNRQRLAFRKRELQARDLRLAEEKKRPRRLVGNLKRSNGMAKFVPHPDGFLSIYKLPEHHHEYIIGGDVAEGIVKGKDPDACCAQVFDRHTWEQVAVFHARCTPTEFAEAMELLGYWYGTAYLVPERNNHGHTVVTILQQRRYPRLHTEQDPDYFGNEPVDKPGWQTSVKTRPMMIDAIDDGINGDLVIWNDIPTIDELMTFVFKQKNESKAKAEGDTGCHDDRVIASGISLAVMQYGVKAKRPSSGYDPHRSLDPVTRAAYEDLLRLTGRAHSA